MLVIVNMNAKHSYQVSFDDTGREMMEVWETSEHRSLERVGEGKFGSIVIPPASVTTVRMN